MDRGALARFMRNVAKDRVSGCWVWTGPKMPNGYGKFRERPGAPERAAHRLSYEHFVGPIPDGLDLDHVKSRGCTTRACVNWAHLEPVTRRENILRQDHAKRRLTHCPRHHPYSAENTLIGTDGKRRCRACRALDRRT